MYCVFARLLAGL